MGLRSTVASAVGTAFSALGDIPVSVTYKVDGGSVYDETLGTYTRSDTDLTLTAVILNYSEREVRSSEALPEVVLPTDQKGLFKVADFSTAPKVSERVVISGETWNVISIGTDPTDSLYTLQLRRA